MFDPTAVQAAPAPPRGPNPFALLAGIWFRPGRTLRVVAAGPAWLWTLPFFSALVLATGLAFAGAPAREVFQRGRGQAAVSSGWGTARSFTPPCGCRSLRSSSPR